jgi:hypothetical protein
MLDGEVLAYKNNGRSVKERPLVFLRDTFWNI